MYGTVDELARILQIRSPTVGADRGDDPLSRRRQLARPTRSWPASTPFIDGRQVQLATEVVYDRAREHWQQ